MRLHVLEKWRRFGDPLQQLMVDIIDKNANKGASDEIEGEPSLIQKLERKNIPIFKVAQYHRSWLVSLTEIAKFCRGGPDV